MTLCKTHDLEINKLAYRYLKLLIRTLSEPFTTPQARAAYQFRRKTVPPRGMATVRTTVDAAARQVYR